ncbi:MAG: MFS transporter, partial [Clostridiales bacterium]|nr:MFS transporter [Clostridiales bacterium]
LIEDGQTGLSLRELLSKKVFWILLLMMICAGASEQAVSQWASTLAEKGLGVSKTVGDLAGPMAFAILMGTSRAIYGKFGQKLNLDKFMSASCILCVASYLLIAVVPNPVVNLAGCAVCGFSVGIMWPGSFSKASASLPLGGTLMFAFLALGGDVGCAGGPTFAGLIASAFNDNLQLGILFAIIFPLGLFVLIQFLKSARKVVRA